MGQQRIIIACLLGAFASILLVLGETFAAMTFLGNYSADTLPYYYLGTGIFSFLVTQFVILFIKNDVFLLVKWSNVIYIILLTTFIFLLDKKIFLLPYFLSISLVTISLLAYTNLWNLITLLFNIREYKVRGPLIVSSATIGGIIIGSLIPLILKILPAYSLLIIYIFIICLTQILLAFTPNTSEKKAAPSALKKGVKIGVNYLFIYLFIFTMLMIFVYTGVDFVFKSELASVFNQKQIGEFLGLFSAVAMTITVISQYFIAPFIIKRFGVLGMMASYPALLLVSAIFMLIMPSLWTATILAAASQVGRYAFATLGKQLVLNVFPRAVRTLANLKLQASARNVSVVSISVLLAALVKLSWENSVVFLIILVSLGMLFLSFLLGKYYYSSLKDAINLHRFNLDYLSTKKSDDQLKDKIIEIALQDKSEDVILYALGLLEDRHPKKIADSVLSLLGSSSKAVKFQVIKLINISQDKTALDALFNLLKAEPDIDIVWTATETILAIDPNSLLTQANTMITSDIIHEKSLAIATYLIAGDSDQIQIAKMLFVQLQNSLDPIARIWASKILHVSRIKAPVSFINKLINDDNLAVAYNAIEAAEKIYDAATINTLLDKLSQPKLKYIALKTLEKIGAPCEEHLLNRIKISTNNISVLMTLLKLLSHLNTSSAETHLIKFTQTNNIILATYAAINIAYRSRIIPLSNRATKQLLVSIHQMIEYSLLFGAARAATPVSMIKNEIDSRLSLIRKAYLHLLAAYFNKEIILLITPTLLTEDPKSRIYADAVELLELNIDSTEIKKTLPYVLEEKISKAAADQQKLIDLDIWYKKLIQYLNNELSGETMGIVNRVILLRKISLFTPLSAEAIASIAENLEKLDISKDEKIFAEGDIGNGLYILSKGTVEISKLDEVIARYEAPDYFGELALLDNDPRYGTATATSDAELFFLEKTNFDRISDELPEILKVLIRKILEYYRKQTV